MNRPLHVLIIAAICIVTLFNTTAVNAASIPYDVSGIMTFYGGEQYTLNGTLLMDDTADYYSQDDNDWYRFNIVSFTINVGKYNFYGTQGNISHTQNINYMSPNSMMYNLFLIGQGDWNMWFIPGSWGYCDEFDDHLALDVYGGGDTSNSFDNLSYKLSRTPVPEPATMFLLGFGILGLIGSRKKFN